MKQNRQIVFEKLMEYIAKGSLRANEKLPSENSLARILNVKRNDVREAVMALELIGLVKTYQGKGAFLTHFELSEASNPFSLMIMLQQGNPDEIMAVRALLETEAARLCALHRTGRDLAQLQATIDNLNTKKDAAFCSREDLNFHSIVAKSSGNQLLQTMIHFVFGYISYVSLNNWDMLTKPENNVQRLEIIGQHEALFLAIKEGSPQKAALCVREHLSYIHNNLNQKIREDYQQYEKQKGLLWF